MTQNIANHLQVCACVDLSAGMGMTKNVCAQHPRRNTCPFCVQSDAMANRAAGDRRIRHAPAKEHSRYPVSRRPFPSQVRGQGLGDYRQQRQLNADLGLGSTNPEHTGSPVQILHAHRENLSSAETVCRQ